MKNKIEEIVLEITGQPLGCYDDELNEISEKNLETLKEALNYGGNTDVPMTLGNVKGIVEIEYWDGEVDLKFMELKAYKNLYK